MRVYAQVRTVRVRTSGVYSSHAYQLYIVSGTRGLTQGIQGWAQDPGAPVHRKENNPLSLGGTVSKRVKAVSTRSFICDFLRPSHEVLRADGVAEAPAPGEAAR